MHALAVPAHPHRVQRRAQVLLVCGVGGVLHQLLVSKAHEFSGGDWGVRSASHLRSRPTSALNSILLLEYYGMALALGALSV